MYIYIYIYTYILKDKIVVAGFKVILTFMETGNHKCVIVKVLVQNLREIPDYLKPCGLFNVVLKCILII